MYDLYTLHCITKFLYFLDFNVSDGWKFRALINN